MQRKGNWKEVAKEEAFEKANFIWKPTNFNYKMYTKIDQIQKDSQSDRHDKFVVNHLENIKRICTKTGLIKTLKTYYKGNAEAIDSVYSVFDSTPTSFVVSSSLDTYEYHQFVARYMDLQRNEGHSAKERIPQKHCTENYWLVKPANMNQGRGIEIFNDLQEIQKFLSSRPMFSYWVIQKYIEKPLLFKNRKFDIRVWALATHDNEFYFYKDGYLRTSSDAYSLDNENNYVHLTNNCLQKNGDNYGKFEDGNTIGFEAFQEYLDKEFPQYKLNVNEHFLKRIRDLMLDVYHSSRKQMNPLKRKNCFELFGFDFIIDEDFRIWLLEVNTNPYLGIPNEYIKVLLPNMIDDMLNIVLDPVFNQAERKANNQFELLYSKNLGVNLRRKINEGIYPVKELEQIRQTRHQLKIKKANQDKQQNNSLAPRIKEDLILQNSYSLAAQNKTMFGRVSPKLTMYQQQIPRGMNLATNLSVRNLQSLTNNQIKSLAQSNPSFKKDFNSVLNQIIGTLINNELFSEYEIEDSQVGLQLLAQTYHYSCFSNEETLSKIFTLINNDKIPLKIKSSILESIKMMLKNFQFKKQFILNHTQTKQNLINLFKLANNCQNLEDFQIYHQVKKEKVETLNLVMTQSQMKEISLYLKLKEQDLIKIKESQLQDENEKKIKFELQSQTQKELHLKEQEEKRKKAEEYFQKRIEEKRKLQLEQMKKEMVEREKYLKEEEERKKIQLENLRKKEEIRKQKLMEQMKRKLEEDQKQNEELSKREFEKHLQKINPAQDLNLSKVKVNKSRYDFINHFEKNKRPQIKLEKIHNGTIKINKSYEFEQDMQSLDQGELKRKKILLEPLIDTKRLANLSKMSMTGTLNTPQKTKKFNFEKLKQLSVTNQDSKQKQLEFKINSTLNIDDADKFQKLRNSQSQKSIKQNHNVQTALIQNIQQLGFGKAISILPALGSLNLNDVSLQQTSKPLKESDIRLFNIYGLQSVSKDYKQSNKKGHLKYKINKDIISYPKSSRKKNQNNYQIKAIESQVVLSKQYNINKSGSYNQDMDIQEHELIQEQNSDKIRMLAPTD
eukprot:403362257